MAPTLEHIAVKSVQLLWRTMGYPGDQSDQSLGLHLPRCPQVLWWGGGACEEKLKDFVKYLSFFSLKEGAEGHESATCKKEALCRSIEASYLSILKQHFIFKYFLFLRSECVNLNFWVSG